MEAHCRRQGHSGQDDKGRAGSWAGLGPGLCLCLHWPVGKGPSQADMVFSGQGDPNAETRPEECPSVTRSGVDSVLPPLLPGPQLFTHS